MRKNAGLPKGMLTDAATVSYSVENMTCYILPGACAREYVVKATAPLISATDVMLGFLLLLFIWILPKYQFYYLGAVAIWIRIKMKTVKEESILAMRDIGIQVKTTYWGGSSVSRFVNRLKIEDVVLNEGITMWQIKSYMALLVKDQEKMTVVFEHLLPKLQPILLDVYRGVRQTIFPQQPTLETLPADQLVETSV